MKGRAPLEEIRELTGAEIGIHPLSWPGMAVERHLIVMGAD